MVDADTLEGAAPGAPFGVAAGVALTAVLGAVAEGATDAFAEPVGSAEVAANAAPIPTDNNTDNAVSLNVFMIRPLFESYSPKSWSTYSTAVELKVLTQIINYLCQPQWAFSVTLFIIFL